MWDNLKSILLVTFVTSFITTGLCHDQTDPVEPETAVADADAGKAILSADTVATETRQEPAVLQEELPVKDAEHETPQKIKEPDLVNGQVVLPVAVEEASEEVRKPDSGVNDQPDQQNNADKTEQSTEDSVTGDTHIPATDSGELSDDGSKKSLTDKDPLPICSTSVFDTDVSESLTQSPSEVPREGSQADAGEDQGNTQGEVTPESAPEKSEQGDNSAEAEQADDTLEEVRQFIKEAVDSTTKDKVGEDSTVLNDSEKEPVGTLSPGSEASSQHVEIPVVEIRGTTAPAQPQEDGLTPQSELPTGGEFQVEVANESSDSGEATGGDQEEFPSFGEWTAKVLAEEEKSKLEQESLGNMPGGAVQPKAVKQSRNNYASRDCGAKILGANREAQNTNGILNGNKDDYMTNPCTAKKWFIIELCEPIQVRTFELASFELFSSQPKTFKVHLSDRYPVKEWRQVGTFHATEERSTQSFQVEDEHFSKFVKVEMVDHFREEHFCPLTLFRVFGVDLNYMTDDEDGGHDMGATSQDPDTGDLLSNDEEVENPTNLFESAKDTVISLVKKVLKVEDKPESEQVEDNPGVAGNSTDVESEGTNLTEDGFPLPCIPDVRIPVAASSDNSSVTVPSDIQPSEPYPHATTTTTTGSATSTTANDKFVVKLEDHEQLPSEARQETQPLVTLIDWKYWSSYGMKDVALRCSSCTHDNGTSANQTTDGRKNCIYVNLLLGNLQPQSCPMKNAKHIKKPKAKDAVKTKDSPSPVSSSHATDTVKNGVGEKVNQQVTEEVQDDPSEKDISSSKVTEPNFVVVSSSYRGGSTVKAAESLKDSESVSGTDHERVKSSETLKPSVEISIVEEPIQSVSFSSTLSSVEPSKVMTDGEDLTMYPQPGQVVIPSAVAPSVAKESVENSPAPESGTTPDVSGEKGEEAPPVELEPSYDNLSVTKKISHQDEVVVSTTPELPPLNRDSTVSLSPPGGDGSVNKGEETLPSYNNGQQNDSGKESNTEPPAEVTREATLVQPTPVDDAVAASQDNKVVKAVNQSDTKTGDDGKKDLNLIRVPVSPHMKRETAIMRLNNRLKALELNVSLSSRFLEELSKRYRKQSDEVMKLLNKTMSKLSNTTKLVEEKDHHNRQLIGILEARIDNLTSLVTKLADSVGNMDQKLTERNFTWATMEVVVVLVLLLMSWRRAQSPYITPEVQKLLQNMPTGPGPPKRRRRRNSSTGTIGYSSPSPPLTKHSSESALDAQTEFSVVEPLVTAASSDMKLNEGNKKKKKKKHKNLESKSSIFSGMKEVTPSSSSASNQSSSSTAGAFNGPGRAGQDVLGSYQSQKPRSNSHSGPMTCQQSSSVVVPGEKRKLSPQNSDSSSGSSTSIASVWSDRDGPVIVHPKFPGNVPRSASCSCAPASQPVQTKVSKSASYKGLANANMNRNATATASKKSKEAWHCRAQSDGNVTVDDKLSAWSSASKPPPDGASGRRRSTETKLQSRLVSHPPETLCAVNGADVTKLASDQSDKGRKWPGGWKKIIPIK